MVIRTISAPSPAGLLFAMLLVAAPVAPAVDGAPGWRAAEARADSTGVSAKEAFEAAKELGTREAWEAFLASYPTGFYADLARAYMRSLVRGGAPAQGRDASGPAVPAAAAPEPSRAAAAGEGDLPPTDPARPAVARGGQFMGFAEQFNRYYTDPTWKPRTTLYVSPDGKGRGTSREAPMAAEAAVKAARPGVMIRFAPGKYQGCFEFTPESSGTYDDPIVLYGERNADGSLGVAITCCKSGRQTCFNLESAGYIAIDGFELIGGQYGVRAVGASYAVADHTRGVAVIDCKGHDQERDPFFSGPVDWAVWERNVAYGAKAGDGHGLYLAGDWHIVRFNETYGNASSDFQINADPDSTCKEEGIAFDDPRCDGYAGEGDGGQGASDYFLIDGNFFHRSEVGPNFTSVRRSVIRNNIFGPQKRHNVSFWQGTDNPKLGSSDNRIVHNLFITTGRHAVQFKSHSNRNQFVNNILVGVREGGTAANPSALLMEVDDTVGDNVYRGNVYVSGKLDGRTPSEEEKAVKDFSAAWFARFTGAMTHDPADFRPAAGAPWLDAAAASPDAPTDRTGAARDDRVDAGPIEAR